MNPMTNMKNVKKLSEQELHRSSKTSWHDQYRDSAWIFIGGLPYDLTEGDLICVFSQYGEIVNINLVRDKDTGKQRGFCFVCYEDQRSTVLAVDNLNGIKILGRTIRVDHVNDYKMPKDHKNADAETKKLQNEGCAPSVKPVPLPIPVTELPKFAKEEEAPPDGFRLPPRLPIGQVKLEKLDEDDTPSTSTKKSKSKKSKKSKKTKKKKNKKKHKKHSSSDESSSSSDSSSSEDSTSDSENETKKKRKTDEKQNKDKVEEIQIKIERPSVDRIKTEDIYTRKQKTETKVDMKYNEQRNFDNFKQNRREFDKYDNRRNYNDRRDYRNFNNDRDRKLPNHRDERKMGDNWGKVDRKRYNEHRDNRDDSKRYRR